MLLERGLITPDQLREALVERARNLSDGERQATPLGGILVRKGFLTDSQLLGLMAEQGQGQEPSPFEAPPPSSPRSALPLGSGPTLPAITVPDPLIEGGQLGKYRLVRELGRGGMGVVYEALDAQLNRKVALKLMLSNPNADPKERALEEERFVQEAQLSAKLKHPHIVTVYEAGLLEGRQFLSMEMIEGQAFNDWRKTVTLREQIRVLADVSGAVHHAHEQGILHRDLKPRNILVSAAGHAYVTDFGLAKSLGKNVHHSLTGSGAVVGTPAYMSPEQAQGLDRVDWRTDIYSLGVILYECMTGRTPFTGESPIEILMKVVKDPVVPPLQVVDAGVALGLDKGIENICLKALAKKDRDRYVTAQAFADDLAKWLAGEKVHVVAPKTRGKGHRKMYAAAGLVFLAMLCGFGWMGLNTARASVKVPLEMAKKYMLEENYSEAMIQFRVALAAEPNNMEALLGTKAAQDGINRKDRERDEKLKMSVIEKFRDAEEAQLRAADLQRRQKEAQSEEERQKLAEEARQAELEARRKAETAAKAEEDFRRTQLLVVAPPGTPVDAWRDAINLLPLIDPRRNAIWGTWELQEGRLGSDRSPFARVEIPFQLPQEYDFRMVFERRTGAGSVNVILSRGGRQFRCEMGGETNTRFAFESAKQGQAPEATALRMDALCLKNNLAYTVLLQVRADGAKAFLNGKLMLSWLTDYADIGLNPQWKLRNTLRLGIGSSESETIFHRLELLEITGKGRALAPQPPPIMRALNVVPANLKPGLVGEYYLGTGFQSLAVRKIDSAIDFRWNEGPAWAGGPTDAFSCRWTGYLHVPRSGKYYFNASADDGVRVFIDDIQLLAAWNGRTEQSRAFDCALEEGYHRFTLEYFEQAYLATMVLGWSTSATQPPMPIAPKSYFHAGADIPVFVAPRLPELVGVVPGHSQNVNSVAFDPKGKIVAVAGEDHKVRLFEPATMKDLGSPATHPMGVLCVTFSPLDGATFATGARDNKIRVWDTQNRTELRTFEGPTSFVQCLAFSPDGKRLAAGSFDRSIRIWTLDSEDDPRLLTGHTDGVESLAFSRDGKKLASVGRDHMLRIWDTETAKELQAIEGHADHVEAVVFSPGGRTLATTGGDGVIKLWDLDTGKELKTLAGHGDDLMCLAFSADGLLLAAGGNDGIVRIWDPVQGRETKTLAGHTARVSSLAFAPSGRVLVSGSADASVRFWNLEK
jgi:WD40 repeat protein/predicted Ser/Thr protein kinase